MPAGRAVHVHLLPDLIPRGELGGAVAVVIDVLRATTTIVHALAAGCIAVRPCLEVEQARTVAAEMLAGKAILGGERGGRPLPGFDLGNSPAEYTSEVCAGQTLVLTTTNGTRALLAAQAADRVLAAAFVNFSAVGEQLRQEQRPIQIICAGTEGEITLEDTILAGALVDLLRDQENVSLNDSARLAWDAFEHHGHMLQEALLLSKGGANLHALGYDEDIAQAARVDQFALVPELRRDPLRIEIGSVGVTRTYWKR